MDLYNPLVDRFTLHDAGFLLCNHAPLQRWNPKHGSDPYEVIRKRAEMTIAELERSATKGVLRIVDKSIERSELERWATTKDIRPVFLFLENEPEDVLDNLLAAYKHIDVFTLHEAGFLLCDYAPLPVWWPKQGNDPHEIIRSHANMTSEGLERDARSGKLNVFDRLCDKIKFRKDGLTDEEHRIKSHGRGILSLRGCAPCDRWRVMRHDLKDWAEMKNVKPAFLYSDAEEQIVDYVDESNATEQQAKNSNVNNRHQKTENYFNEEQYSAYDAGLQASIIVLFTRINEEDWKKFFDKAKRHNLDAARQGMKGKSNLYNPVKVAEWLIKNNHYRYENIARTLDKNLPPRSRHYEGNLFVNDYSE